MPTIVTGIKTLLDLASANKKCSKSLTRQNTGTGSSINNPSVNCDKFNKSSYTWRGYEGFHKCMGYGNRKHGFESCIKKKWTVGMGDLSSVLLNSGEIVYIIGFIASNKKLSLLKFMSALLCFFALPRANTRNHFQHVDASQLPLQKWLLFPNSVAQIKLLNKYSGSLQIYPLLIPCFRVQLGYKRSDAFILSKNSVLALADIGIINKKLVNDLRYCSIEKVTNPILLFISSFLGILPNYNGD